MGDQERPKLVITEQQVQTLARRLRQLHGESGAECAFVSDMDGNILARVGMTVGFDLETLALFVGKWFGAAAEIAWYLGDSAAFDLNYHDGAWYDLYAANIGKHLSLTLLFTKTAQTGKIGMVWVLTRRAVAELLKLLESATLTEPPKPVALPQQKPLTAPTVTPQVTVAVEIPAPAAPEPDELERELLLVADESRGELFTGMTYEQAKAMGLLDSLLDEE
jgi:hypothetical protein